MDDENEQKNPKEEKLLLRLLLRLQLLQLQLLLQQKIK
jgi:hypothetical protein